jgi:crotonobetainyl-CoA:carnitine CoA-transferase CaiB-like acyl-CoA transferase
MSGDNIFSGLKVVDLASFIAGPAAAVMLGDFGADVVKVEPPHGDTWRIGYKVPPEPAADDNYPWHLNNRNKRGLALDLKSPEAKAVLRKLVEWADVLIVNTPHPARKKLELEYDDVKAWNPRLIYADVTGFGEAGPDAHLPGFDITAYWGRSGLLSLTRDAGASPTLPVSGSGDHATAVVIFSAIVTGLYRRERTGQGSYVSTSLLASGVWAAGVMVQAALAGGTFYPQHDRRKPASATFNVYRSGDDKWFLIVMTPDKWAGFTTAIGRPELATDPRFADPAKQNAHVVELAAILDDVFAGKPFAHWANAFDAATVPFGVVSDPADVILDPQLTANNIVVPLEGAGGKLTSTVSSPIEVHGVAKQPAHRGPELGEHNEEILREIGFDAAQIRAFADRQVIASRRRSAAA